MWEKEKLLKGFEAYIKNKDGISDELTVETADLLLELFDAMSNFYAVIPIRRVYEIITGNYGIRLSEEAFLQFCEFIRENDRSLYFFVLGEDELESDDTPENAQTAPFDRELIAEFCVVVDMSIYQRIKELKDGKPWYIPDMKYMLEQREENDYERTPQYMSMLEYLRKSFSIGRTEADKLMQELSLCVRREDRDLDSVISDLIRMRYVITPEFVRDIIPYYIEFSNNIRMPMNNGYTPSEAEALRGEYGFTAETGFVKDIPFDEEEEKKKIELAVEKYALFADRYDSGDDDYGEDYYYDEDDDEDDDVIDKDFINDMRMLGLDYGKKQEPVRVTKIGRNEPCPCGSGKKYKKCCGR